MKKRILAAMLSGMLIVGMTGCGFTDGVKDGMNDAMCESEEETEDPEVTEEVTETPEPTEEVTETPEPTEEVTETPEPETTEEPEEESKTGNPLLDADLQTGKTTNGNEYAWVEVPIATMKAVTMEQYAEFCNERVTDRGYNWVTIDFKNGKGLQFQGSTSAVATYGTIDSEKCIDEQYGVVMASGDDTYTYSEF